MIRAENVSLIYHDHDKEIYACKNINFTINQNEFVGILGPSGSGKSSLLYLMSGLKTPTQGKVQFDNLQLNVLSENQLAHLRKNSFGFVFQQPFLIGYLTAIENVIVSISNQNISTEHAIQLLEQLGLADKINRFPADLSGGEKQRVCIARALIAKPKVLFADEPTASLDHDTGIQIVELLRTHRSGPLVMVTHDESMLKNADRILYIEEGELKNNTPD